MDELIWICPECGSPNPYPEITECEVCSSPITEKEIAIAEKKIREAERLKEELERAERKALEEKRRQEAELERLKKIEEKNRLKRAAAVKSRKHTQKLNDIMKPLIRTVSAVSIIAVLACSVISGISVVRQDTADVMTDKIELIAQRLYEDFNEAHYYTYSDGEGEFAPMRNFRIQMQYIERHFSNSRGIRYLEELLGW